MSESKLVFYTHPMSRGRIVRWMLAELAVPYETVLLDYASSMKAPEYLAINPMGKVPAIIHDGHVVTEAAAVCLYLADVYPEKALAPAVSNRADYYRWILFSAGPLEQAITNNAMGFDVPPNKTGMVGYGSYKMTLDVLEGALRGKTFLVGERFSVADVIVGSQIGFGLAFGSLEKRPEFVRYWQGLSERPAKVQADAIDNALMPKK
jgi:glutathione S-transferase